MYGYNVKSSLRDYKDWIQERAFVLANELYDEEFYNLPENLQDKVYNQASEDYTDAYSSWCDAEYERWRDRRLGL